MNYKDKTNQFSVMMLLQNGHLFDLHSMKMVTLIQLDNMTTILYLLWQNYSG